MADQCPECLGRRFVLLPQEPETVFSVAAPRHPVMVAAVPRPIPCTVCQGGTTGQPGAGTARREPVILDRNGFEVSPEREHYAQRVMKLLALEIGHPHYDAALAEARVGWPAFRIADWLGMNKDVVNSLVGR